MRFHNASINDRLEMLYDTIKLADDMLATTGEFKSPELDRAQVKLQLVRELVAQSLQDLREQGSML